MQPSLFTPDVCTHRAIHLEGGRMIPIGELRGLGDCINQDLACPDCGAVVGELSMNKKFAAASETPEGTKAK